MKNIIFLFFLFSLSLAAQSLPVAGKTYLLKYDPAEKIFSQRILKLYLFTRLITGAQKELHQKDLSLYFKMLLNPIKEEKKKSICHL